MTKTIFTLSILLIASLSLFSQTEVTEMDDNPFEYSHDKSGLFYIVIPIDQTILDDNKVAIKNLIDKKGLLTIRVSTFKIKDIKGADFSYLIVRKFDDEDGAIAFVDAIKNDDGLNKFDPLIFTQGNYRKFLKKKDLAEYLVFLSHQ